MRRSEPRLCPCQACPRPDRGCKDCGHEYLLAFSCKRRHFCPSCHQKRVVEFGEWLCLDVLKKVPHRHFIFSIPKRDIRLGAFD
ncbi:MAG: transposase zinc-binding domain-containing protein [Smithella sp.]